MMNAAELDNLIAIAYKKIGVVLTGQGLINEATYWESGCNAEGKLAWFVAFKDTKHGRKILGWGQNGTPFAKERLLNSHRDMILDPDQHIYVEASGCIDAFMRRWHVPVVGIDAVRVILAGKEATPLPDDYYSRKLTDGPVVTKRMYGYPIVEGLK